MLGESELAPNRLSSILMRWERRPTIWRLFSLPLFLPHIVRALLQRRNISQIAPQPYQLVTLLLSMFIVTVVTSLVCQLDDIKRPTILISRLTGHGFAVTPLLVLIVAFQSLAGSVVKPVRCHRVPFFRAIAYALAVYFVTHLGWIVWNSVNLLHFAISYAPAEPVYWRNVDSLESVSVFVLEYITIIWPFVAALVVVGVSPWLATRGNRRATDS